MSTPSQKTTGDGSPSPGLLFIQKKNCIFERIRHQNRSGFRYRVCSNFPRHNLTFTDGNQQQRTIRKLKFQYRKRGKQMYEEQTIPLTQYWTLQALVSELLVTKQKLREQVAQLVESAFPSALATHPQLPQDH